MKVGDVYALLGMDFSQFNKDERTAKSRVEGLGSSLSGIIKNAFSFGLGMSFFAAIQRGFKATVGTAVSFNDTLQQAQIGFTTMLGSARKADAFLSDLAKFAARTPFEFEGLLDASKRMMALGFAASDVLPTMTAIGDTAAALGSGQEGIDSLITGLGNIKTQGKVTSYAMMSLARAGVPSWEILAEAIGKTTGETRDLVERGLVSADAGIAALTQGMTKRFGGMMQKMEDSWRGVTSTIKDVWQMTLGAVTKNLFGRANEWLKKVRDTAQGFYDAFQEGGLQYAIEQTFGARAAASVNVLTSALRGLWGMVTGVAGTIVRNWTLIRNLTLGVVWAFLTFKTIAFTLTAVAWATNMLTIATGILRGEAIKTSLETGILARAVQIYNLQLHLATAAGYTHVGMLAVLKTALYSLWNSLGPIGWAILAISAALGIGISVWSKYNQAVQSAAQKAQTEKMAAQQQAYEDAVNQAAQGTENQADALGDLGKAAGKNLQSFDEIHSLTEDTAGLAGADLGVGVTGLGAGGFQIPEFDMSAFTFDMDAAISEAKSNMGGFWGWLGQGFKNTFTAIGGWLKGVWSGIWGALCYIGTGTVEILKAVIVGFVEFFKGAIEAGVLIVKGIVWTLTTAWKAVWGVVSYILEGTVEVLKAVILGFVQFFVGLGEFLVVVWKAVWGAIKGAAKTVVGWLISIWDDVKTTWGAFRDWVGQTWDGIVKKFASLKTTLFGHIIQPFVDARNFIGGIIRGAWDWGKNLVSNFVDGIKSVPGKLKDGLASVGNTIKGWLGFESPTQEGPGRYADQWAPNLMRMYASGILANVSMVQSAAGVVARSLTPMAAVPAPVFAGMGEAPTSRSGGDGGWAGSSAGASERPLTLIVKIGDETLIDRLITGINRTTRGRGEVQITT